MGGFLLPILAGVRRKGVIESFPVDVLRVRRQV